ncbi:MAG: hypothetical protein AB7C95_00925 [Synergistaceae bacterium]
MDIKITNIDKKSEVDGVWMDYLGVSICVARQNNPAFLDKLKELSAKEGRRPFHKLPSKKRNEVIKRTIAETIIVGWEGFMLGGKELEYTPENAYQLISNDPECLNAVTTFSMDLENYIAVEEEETGEE